MLRDCVMLFYFFFFFSSRRRHTRWTGDWSSDVCSSDLGTFLKDFIGERDGKPIPWAHLDIAGPAFNQGEPYGYTPKGGTGIAVRTFVQLAEDLASQTNPVRAPSRLTT